MKKVLILLSNGFEILEAATFIDILGWANVFGNEKIEIVTAGSHEKLNSTFGLQVIPNAQITDINIDDFDALAIPGGFEKAGFYQDGFSEEFLKLIRYFDEKKKIIASICVPIFTLVFGKPTEIVVFMSFLCLIIIYRHRSNISRLKRREEKKVKLFRKSKRYK